MGRVTAPPKSVYDMTSFAGIKLPSARKAASNFTGNLAPEDAKPRGALGSWPKLRARRHDTDEVLLLGVVVKAAAGSRVGMEVTKKRMWLMIYLAIVGGTKKKT